MKKFVVILVLGFAVAALFFFVASIPQKWHQQELERHAEAVRVWEQKKADEARIPGKIARINALIEKREYASADAELAELQKIAPPSSKPRLAHIRAKIQYRLCERHIINFDYFASVERAKDAGAERDKAALACERAEKMLAEVPGDTDAEFYRRYAEGNTAVRKAIVAVSQEAQLEALKVAIRSYKKALEALDKKHPSWNDDDRLKYERTAINLELLFSLQKNAENAARGGDGKDKAPLSPDQFQLKPRPGPGAGDGTSGRSRL